MKDKLLTRMWAALIGSALCTFTVSAATLTVTNPVDNTPGSLRSQVAAASAGDTIVFDASLTNGIPQLLLTGEITVEKSLYFMGNGSANTIVSGNSLSRIFHIDDAGSVHISGMAFTNGTTSGSGGAIYIDSTDVTLSASNVMNSTASGNAATEGGGGIYNNSGMLTIINNSIIADNSATGTSGSGGGILNSGGGELTVMGSVISGNTSNRAGGGIEGTATGGDITLTNTDLLDNITYTAPGNGGGLHVTGANMVTVNGGIIRNNEAGAEGGGFWNNGGTMNISGATIDSNNALGVAADNGGGGVFNNGGTVSITNNTMIAHNIASGTSGSGGGVFNDVGGSLTIMGSSVVMNSAMRAGGGIEDNSGNGSVTLNNTNLDDNMTASNPGNGGGMHVTGGATISISGGSVNGNMAAREGGGLWNGSGTMTISGVMINDNEAQGAASDDGGGGVFNQGGTVIINNNTHISNNSATGVAGSGGGIFNNTGGSVTVSGSMITANSAMRAGGGIEDQSGSGMITLNNSNLDSNMTGSASGNGGGLHVTGTGDVAVNGGSVNYNTATAEGGGLWNGAGTMTVSNTMIHGNVASGNDASQGGGGVFNLSGDLTINNNTMITGNMADGTSGSGGGILNDSTATLTVSGSTIKNNSASRAGGGIEDRSFATGGVTLNNVNLDSNMTGSAPGNGGGLHVTGNADVNISGGTVNGNTAAREGGGLWNGAGTMTISGVDIWGNEAQGPAADDGGGGVFNNGGTVSIINNTHIAYNSATGTSGSGGGVFNLTGGELSISGSSIMHNMAMRAGGGIEDASGAATTVTINNSNLDSNSTAANPGNGGAVHISGDGDMDITGGTVNGNTASREGGGLWNGTGTMTVSGTTIEGNEANGNASDDGGGGIFNNGGTVFVINNSMITNNHANGTAGSGGGIFNGPGSSLSVMGSTLMGNTASRAGGAIEDQSGNDTVKLTNTDMIQNSTGSAPGNGGGLHITGGGNAEITGGEISGNYAAAEGGGVWNGAGMMMISGVQISNNTAAGDDASQGGGGVYNLSGTVHIVNNSMIKGNMATGSSGSGGGILNDSTAVLLVQGSSITNNSSNRAGGGIEDRSFASGGVTLNNVNLDSNMTGSAPGNGGGLHVTGNANIDISGGTVNGNTAAREGGGLWNGTGMMMVDGTTIDGNTASGDAATDGGGGIWNNGGIVQVMRSTVSNNMADGTDGAGGGIYDAEGTTDVFLTTVSGNSANGSGGGLYSQGTINVVASTVANNSAGGEGGGIDITLAATYMVDLHSTIVADNSAGVSGQDVGSSGGVYTSSGYNLVEMDDQNVFPAMGSDIEGHDPNLGPLADNGGDTKTQALMCPSPAVDAGEPTLNADDQRMEMVFGGTRDIGSFELQTPCNAPVIVCNSYVTDGTWMKSTTVTPSNLSGTWSGVNGNLPADGTFSMNAMLGQPYSFQSIDSIDGASVIQTGRDITYFRKSIMIDSLQNFDARLRLLVDDQAEVYVNGKLLAGQYTGSRNNYKLPSFDAMFNNDNTVDNPNGGGVAYDATSSMDLDDIFKVGMNTITVAVRNYAKASDRGGFTLRLDLCGEKINGGAPTMDSLVSSNGFEKSTVITPSNFSGFWGGVSSLPATSTYTMAAVEGQPYSFPSIDAVPGSKVISTESSDITYYRREFSLTSSSNLDARIMMTVDDGMEVYINGQLIAREENVSRSNYKAPAHDVKFNANGTVMNGFMGGDMFDFTTLASMDDVFNTGMNELVVVVRNLGRASDRGGFSFRMEVESNGQSVLVADKKVATANARASVASNLLMEVYPNPASGNVNVHYETAGYELMVFDMNGKMMSQQQVDGQDASLDISEYAAGVYFVKVKSGDKVITEKLIKE